MDFGVYERPFKFVETMSNEEYVELLRDCNEEMYEGCQKCSKLSFLLRLYHNNVCGMTNNAMMMILELLTYTFEYGKILTSFYEAKKVIYKFGLNYTKIDVYPKNCLLYWGEDEKLESYKYCNKSGWKKNGTGGKRKLLVKL